MFFGTEFPKQCRRRKSTECDLFGYACSKAADPYQWIEQIKLIAQREE